MLIGKNEGYNNHLLNSVKLMVTDAKMPVIEYKTTKKRKSEIL